MTDFLDMLKSRREAARERLADARKSVVAAEAEVKKWSDAVDLELRSTGQSSKDEDAIEKLKTLTIDSVRRKEDIFRAALRQAKRPLKPAEILKMVKPALSRSSVYTLVNILRASGELEVVDGKFVLRAEKRAEN
jgi:CRP-like cAMP-binding protein